MSNRMSDADITICGTMIERSFISPRRRERGKREGGKPQEFIQADKSVISGD